MFEKMMPGKKYPFIIWSDESGTHWWSILNISPKSEILLIDSFGITGMKRFIAQGNKKIIGKVLKWLELSNRKDNKLTLVKLKYSMNGCDKLTEREINELLETAPNFCHLIQSFAQNENITNFANLDAWRSDTTFAHDNLRTFSNIFLREFVFFPTKTVNYTIRKNLQTLLWRHY